MKKISLIVALATSLLSCKDDTSFVTENPEETDPAFEVEVSQIELSETLRTEEASIFSAISELYQVPFHDSVTRILILDEKGEEKEISASIIYPDTIITGDSSIQYKFARLEFRDLLSGEGIIEYAYGTDLGGETKGSIMILNDVYYHTRVLCDFGGCTSTLEKGTQLIGKEEITTSSSMTTDSDLF